MCKKKTKTDICLLFFQYAKAVCFPVLPYCLTILEQKAVLYICIFRKKGYIVR